MDGSFARALCQLLVCLKHQARSGRLRRNAYAQTKKIWRSVLWFEWPQIVVKMWGFGELSIMMHGWVYQVSKMGMQPQKSEPFWISKYHSPSIKTCQTGNIQFHLNRWESSIHGEILLLTGIVKQQSPMGSHLPSRSIRDSCFNVFFCYSVVGACFRISLPFDKQTGALLSKTIDL